MTATELGFGLPPGSVEVHRRVRRRWSAEGWTYAAGGLLAMAAAFIVTELWNAVWSVPFYYSSDALSSAAYFKTVLDTGWYETQMDLGVPYGQHYHDFPFSDDLHPFLIKAFGLFTNNWVFVFNTYYILGYPLAAVTAVWFLRRCGLSRWMSIALSVLFALAPYHLRRNEIHFFLGEYWPIPLGLGVVLSIVRGEAIWGVRRVSGPLEQLPGFIRRIVALGTGRGAGTVLAIALVTLDGAYYGVFTAVLLAPAGLLALLRTHDWRRFVGAVAAGAVLAAVLVGAMLPDIIYEHVHGSDAGAFSRNPRGAESLALKFTALIMPSHGDRIPALLRIRSVYDGLYPEGGEGPALGLMGAIGFLLLIGMIFLMAAGRADRSAADPERARRWRTFSYLSALTWLALLAGTIGGLGTFISFFTPAIRGWNRISIFINLLSLAGLGLALEGGLAALARRRARKLPRAGQRVAGRVALPVIALLVMAIGVGDQSSTLGVPRYDDASYRSDHAFVASLQNLVPAGSMIFQTPYIPFPESLGLYRAIDNDQLRLFLNSTTLRWSGGGMKGRPQTVWPKTVSAEPPRQMTRNLAVIGFAGIVIDTYATRDNGRSLEVALAPYTGPPVITSQDGRWAYLSLTRALARVNAMAPAQRAAESGKIVNANG